MKRSVRWSLCRFLGGLVLSEVEVVYKCMVCGKAWSKVQSLRAHMKRHKGEGLQRTSIWVHGEKWDWFKGYCKKHNTTTCHLLDSIIDLVKKGDERGVVTLGSSNPVILQLHEYYLAGPRSRYKIPFDPSRVAHNVQPVHCPLCGSKKVRVMQTSDGFVEGRCGCGAEWLIHGPNRL